MDSMKLEDCCEILDSQRVPKLVVIEPLEIIHIMEQMEYRIMLMILFLMMNLYCLLKMVETSDQKHDQLLIEFQENVG